MASVNGVDVTAIAANTKIEKHLRGKVRVITEEYEASALASGSDITIGTLPEGSSLVDAIILFDALGASSTLELGDAGDTDRYIAATSSASAGAVRPSLIAGLRYENTTATDLIITTAGASITGTIKAVITYVV